MFCRCSVTIFLGRELSPINTSSDLQTLFLFQPAVPLKAGSSWFRLVIPISLFPSFPLPLQKSKKKMQRALTSRARASALAGAYKYRSGGSLGQQVRFAHKVGQAIAIKDARCFHGADSDGIGTQVRC